MVYFQELKTRLSIAPVLTLPEAMQFVVDYCDAFIVGLACVLMQKDKVIVYDPDYLRFTKIITQTMI